MTSGMCILRARYKAKSRLEAKGCLVRPNICKSLDCATPRKSIEWKYTLEKSFCQEKVMFLIIYLDYLDDQIQLDMWTKNECKKHGGVFIDHISLSSQYENEEKCD